MPAKPAAPVTFVERPAVTVRAQLEAGDRFEPEAGTCITCIGEEGTVDRHTSLCRPCWRAWRWSPKAEAGAPADVVARKAG